MPRVEIDSQNGVIGSDDGFGFYGFGSNYYKTLVRRAILPLQE